ncbi:SGNH/GDSL hydrolase family protein [Streptomyces monticola]|uniref:SGNH/GDSL hydrolase family protein n=1 Tax=Streptomyces monticola TaxID=2666263 RepID=A0ABW2JBK7_9ACTN
MKRKRPIGGMVGTLVACATLTSLVQLPATAAPAQSGVAVEPSPERTPSAPSSVPRAQRDAVLGKGWKESADRAVTAAADTDGLNILVADSAKAYEWRTAAVLAEPGMPADSWIGNQCVMDRTHVAVVYAPRTATNHPDMMLGGAFTAIVNTETGKVKKLPFTASLAYFDPSCNPDTRTATFTSFRDDKSRLVTVDTAGESTAETVLAGQVTSAVPVADGTIAARGPQLVHINRSGKVKNLADTEHVPFEIRIPAKGKVAFLDRTEDTVRAQFWNGSGRPATMASGKLGDLALKQAGTQQVFLSGDTEGAVKTEGTGVTALKASPDADVSSHGRLAVNPVVSPGLRAGLARIKDAGGGGPRGALPRSGDGSAQPPLTGEVEPLTVTSTAVATGKEVTQSVPEAGSRLGKATLSPALPADKADMRTQVGTAAAADPNNPVDTDRWCSVPRNDVNNQALQPTPNQVEWAVDMAVRGELRVNWITQGGWRNQTGLQTDPQGTFKRPSLTGGGRIPANVLLGVLAQESNLWQAESGAVPGQMGSPLAAVAGFYGHKGDTSSEYWKINWDKSDCGYGVGQVTDGMRLAGHEKPGETSLAPGVQRAVALDYTVNIAASMYILADKWNELHLANQLLTVNNDDASKVENWFAALWNYNLGFNGRDKEQQNGNWGLGWYNNPANPLYPAGRDPFLDADVDPEHWPEDAARPQEWPYQEKVMGWAAWSMDAGYSYATSGRQDWKGEEGYDSAGFRPAWWVSKADRTAVKPPLDAFCNEKNNCNAAAPPDCPDAACYTQYWWNAGNVTWKDCSDSCGNENIKYTTLRAEPGRGYRLQYGTPACDKTGLPGGALVIDDVPAGTQTWSDCGTTASNGSFKFTFNPGTNGLYEAKGDLHQIGGGYDGHFWYAHTRDSAHLGGFGGRMTVTGTWALGQSVEWARVFAHVPDTGAHTQQAHYVIKGVAGGDRDRYINTFHSKNKWVELGVYRFTGTPRVELTNTTEDGTADEDIAYDAVAFQKLAAKPKHMVVTMGDSYTSGEGAGAYSSESDRGHGKATWNACRRSGNSWARKTTLPGQTATIGALADGHSASLDHQDVSCSGAKTWNVLGDGVPRSWSDRKNYASGEGQFHEMSQVESGALTPDTTLVALTIGGNDGNTFQDAVTACYLAGYCEKSDYTARIDTAVAETRRIIDTIDDPGYAENAQIVLMGYPSIFADENANCVGVNVTVMNELADYVRDKQAAMVADLRNSGVKVAYADPIAKFEGHGVCDSDEWINSTVAGPEGDGDFHRGDDVTTICWWVNTCLSRESFHPKQSGTTGYAAVMSETLNSIGYKRS